MDRPLTRKERGELIASAREARGWSQVVLAEASGVDRSLINKIELGRLSGSIESLVALATALDIDLNLLKDGLRPGGVTIAHTPSEEDRDLENCATDPL